MASSANIMEIFSSVQGEGLLVGERQLFVRFCGCNLSCAYCDTQAARGPVQNCRREATPGKGDWIEQPNPVSTDLFLEIFEHLNCRKGLHHSVALTGGEPLLHSRFLSEVLPRISRAIPVMLESNGTLHKELALVLPWIHVVSMDVKMASATGQATDWEAHHLFLEACLGKRAYVKAVLSPEVGQEEIDALTGLIAAIDPSIPLVLQPVHGTEGDLPWAQRLLSTQGACKEQLESVLLIPQLHKVLKIL